jgi:hypothetical protein
MYYFSLNRKLESDNLIYNPRGNERTKFLNELENNINIILLYIVMYKIFFYSKQQAKKLGVQIKPSIKCNKKIDVYKNGVLMTSIGDIRLDDYPTFKNKFGSEYAELRRELHKKNNEKYINIIDTQHYYEDKILW